MKLRGVIRYKPVGAAAELPCGKEQISEAYGSYYLGAAVQEQVCTALEQFCSPSGGVLYIQGCSGTGKTCTIGYLLGLLSLPKEDADSFAQAIVDAKNSVRLCPVCQNLTDQELCGVCADPERDHSLICVGAEPKDVIAMERAREYHGVYHVLHGVISPLSHVGPDDLRIRELLSRVSQGGVREVIMATNPDTEGEATAMYLSRLLRPMDVKVTRLAYGIPVGSQLEYADEVTLLRALEGRQEI